MEKLKEFGKKLMYGRNDYSPKVKKILKEFGNEPINHMYILRTPISKVLRFLMNITSLGAFEKKLKEKDFDDLFHLALHIETDKGRVALEKNEAISMNKKPKRASNAEMMNVSVPQGLTINKMLEKTKELMKQNFFPYSAKDNNCQRFILSILQANGLANKDNTEFIKQDTNDLFSTHLRKASNSVTDFAGKLDVLLQGGSVKKSNHIQMNKKEKERKAKELAHIIIGSGFFDDVSNWTKKATKDVSNWGKKATKDVSDWGKKNLTKKLGNDIVRTGLGATGAVLGTMVAPVSGSVAGAVIGDQAGRIVTGGKVKRKGRFVKGSQEAKEYMASLRAKRGMN